MRELNVAAARLARECADEWTAKTPDKPRFVAGVLGPDQPHRVDLARRQRSRAARNVTLRRAGRRLRRGDRGPGRRRRRPAPGRDDLRHAERQGRAVRASRRISSAADARLPVMISGTITDASGRTLSGQTAEAFWNSVRHARPLAVGLNCALGAKRCARTSRSWRASPTRYVSCYPNAGLPNAMAETVRRDAGADGAPASATSRGAASSTSSAAAAARRPRTSARSRRRVRGRLPPRAGAGSIEREAAPLRPRAAQHRRRLAVRQRRRAHQRHRLERVRAPDPRRRLRRGAVESRASRSRTARRSSTSTWTRRCSTRRRRWRRFLNLIAAEPDIARVPVMIDSSKWEVIEAGLKCVQGKAVVNSICMKEGEAEFLRQAQLVRRYGAAVVVMAFDEKGQADTLERKIEICQRAYDLLIEQVGFPPEDIIFDPEHLRDRHRHRGAQQLRASTSSRRRAGSGSTCRTPRCRGGVSNVSFSFRGNDPVREAIHTAFLYHAIQAGMTWASSTPASSACTRRSRRSCASASRTWCSTAAPMRPSAWSTFAETFKAQGKQVVEDLAWRKGTVEERLSHALVQGITTYIVEDTEEARQKFERPDPGDRRPADGRHERRRRPVRRRQDVPAAGGEVGARDEAGGRAPVPFIEAEKAALGRRGKAKGKIVIATVKGDVHDIGKNIVGVVLQCNNFDVVDLGVMVPAQKILETARERERRHHRPVRPDHAVARGNGARRARDGARRASTLPLLIGGATTSRVHTAVKIAPNYAGADGLRARRLARGRRVRATCCPTSCATRYVAEVARRLRARSARSTRARRARRWCTLEAARANAVQDRLDALRAAGADAASAVASSATYDLAEIAHYIDWTPFFQTWELAGPYPDDPRRPGRRRSGAQRASPKAQAMLKRIVDGKLAHAPTACSGLFPANARRRRHRDLRRRVARARRC